MSLKARDVDAVFRKFQMESKPGKDIWAEFCYGGKVIIRTRRSFGKHRIEGPVRHEVRQQLKLNEEQFARAIGCSLKREGYIQILKKKKLIIATN